VILAGCAVRQLVAEGWLITAEQHGAMSPYLGWP
jgi:hypothetical protein